MIDINTLLVGGIPAVIAIGLIVQLLKSVLGDKLSTRFLPLISVGVGIVLFILASGVFTSASILNSLLYGLVAGLAASGGFDAISKSVLNK